MGKCGNGVGRRRRGKRRRNRGCGAFGGREVGDEYNAGDGWGGRGGYEHWKRRWGKWDRTEDEEWS